MGTNPSSVDHIITNMTSLFMNSCTVETGISDHHKLICLFEERKFFLSLSRGIRIRILEKLDVVAFWSWNLDVVAFCPLKKCLGITMSWLSCLRFSMSLCFSLRISMSWFFGHGISML